MNRAHTGRRRNEQAHRAIVEAAAELLLSSDISEITVERIAHRAGVGRQTIYRRWPSKGAVLAEAMASRAAAAVDVPPSGDLGTDLERFMTATFAAAEQSAGPLRSILSEALRDAPAAAVLAEFAAGRRQHLGEVLESARSRDELRPDVDLELVVEQVFGVLWYRIAVSRQPLGDDLARTLAAAVLAQLTSTGRGRPVPSASAARAGR